MVEHVNIIDSERHEAKGASTASANQVLHANGDGTTTFKFLDYANLLNKPLLEGYERLFFDGNTASQSPVAVNTPIKISFGTGVATADAQLATDGVITSPPLLIPEESRMSSKYTSIEYQLRQID